MRTVAINGRPVTLPEDPDVLLVDLVRGPVGLTGTKLACGSGVCGACTLLLDGAPVASCLTPAKAVAGRSITTVEGIGAAGLHPVQRAFMACDALQCGFCTPGFIVEAVAFHDQWRREKGALVPAAAEVGAALAGHLCRCGAYANILRAVAEACAGRFDGETTASPRLEARDKVTGAALYTVDIRHEGQLEGCILRARVAHARIDALDLRPALRLPGVAAAISLLDEDRTVRYVGQQIAAVAAADCRTARAALAAIAVSYTPLPAAIGPEAARAPGAAIAVGSRGTLANASEGPILPVRWRGNLRGPSAAFSLRPRRARRWVREARRAADPHLVEGTFRTSVQHHTALEPHAAVARFDGDRLTLHVSTQAVSHLKSQIAKRLAVDASNIRVVAEHVGGGFGAKAALGSEAIVAIRLARATQAPVRVAFDRHEELSVAGYRPGARIDIALLPARDGSLKAMSLTAYADTGASVNSTIAGLGRLIYPAKAKYLADFDVVSNLPPAAPFRGPGGPPMAFALEQAIDEAALRLKTDPIALRKRWDPNPNRQRLYAWAAGRDIWRAAASTRSGRFRRGVGVAAGYWLYLWHPGSRVELAVRNGRLTVGTAVQDIGTGSRSVLAEALAGAFGLDPQEIDVRIGDSTLPQGPPSTGSRTTASILPPTLMAAEELKRGIAQRVGRPFAGSNAPWREMIAACPDFSVLAVRREDAPPASRDIRSPLADAGPIGRIFGWMMRRLSHVAVGAGVPSSVQVVEVEVDTLLGHVRVDRVHTGLAVGKLAAPVLAHSQAVGAVIQGIGYALYEGREVDSLTGDVLTAGLEDYRIPGIADTPTVEVHFDEAGFDHVLGGGVGVGEVATIPTAAAIANAIRHAIGVRPTEIPIRADRLLALLQGSSGTLP
jgi:xanthine dehydrogenase YagR molybdenum-binding subunit